CWLRGESRGWLCPCQCIVALVFARCQGFGFIWLFIGTQCNANRPAPVFYATIAHFLLGLFGWNQGFKKGLDGFEWKVFSKLAHELVNVWKDFLVNTCNGILECWQGHTLDLRQDVCDPIDQIELVNLTDLISNGKDGWQNET